MRLTFTCEECGTYTGRWRETANDVRRDLDWFFKLRLQVNHSGGCGSGGNLVMVIDLSQVQL